MRILVTGARGMLGRDLCPLLKEKKYEVLETDIEDLDITNPSQLRDYVKEHKPDLAINCSGYTNVDKAEEEANKAKIVNGIGPLLLKHFCGNLIHISTDYVFNVEEEKPIDIEEEPNPLNEYGRSKWIGEIAAITTGCSLIRTSWLFGEYGKNFITTIAEKMLKSKLEIVGDQIGAPTWTVDLGHFIIELIERNSPAGIWHYCGKGKASWYKVASKVRSYLRELGLKPNSIVETTAEEYGLPANRPKYSYLDCEKSEWIYPQQYWEVGMRKVLERKLG